MGSEEGNEIETLRDSRRWNQKSSLIFISIALVSPSPFEPHKITNGSRMSKNTEIVAMEEPPKQPTPNLFSLFPNFNFNFQLPFLPPKPKPEPQLQEAKQPQEGRNPNVVRFPKSKVVVPPPLEAEPDANHSSTKTSHPFIIWQVYVLGGIIISKWIWARWNERKARGKSPNDDDRAEGRPSDDGHRSSDNE